MFVDAMDPADAAGDLTEVEAASTPAVAPTPVARRPRRMVWRAGAALLAIAAYGASAQLATNEVVVKPGDTLSRLAETYQTSVKELVAYNDLADPNRIYAGQVLGVPPSAGELRHDVRAGETLSEIAATYATTVQAIMTRNQLSDANRIRVGQTLVVPRSTPAPAAPATSVVPPTTVAPAATTSTAAPAAAAATTTAAPAALGVATPSVTAPPVTAPPPTAAPATTAAPTTAAPTSTGPAGTIPRVTVPAGATVSTMWVVQQGDTIASIAARFGLSPRRLASVNALSENDELVPGQRIYVPQS